MKAIDLLEDSPVIAAVKHEEGIERCIQSECLMVFVLYANLSDLEVIVSRLKDAGKTVMIHMDLVQGLSSKEEGVEYIRRHTRADGIISTKPALVKKAKELGLYGVLRAFIIDSAALSTTKKQLDTYKPDMVEIMPGIMPSVLSEVKEYANMPVIAGGLISTKKDIMTAFDAGADGVSTTREELWFM